MFSAPTAIRVLKKQPAECMERYDTSSLKALYLAGEPLDETTSSWISCAEGAGHRQLLADRIGLAHHLDRQGHQRQAHAPGQPWRADAGLPPGHSR
jgi:propionyl-CoA synthetase